MTTYRPPVRYASDCLGIIIDDPLSTRATRAGRRYNRLLTRYDKRRDGWLTYQAPGLARRVKATANQARRHAVMQAAAS